MKEEYCTTDAETILKFLNATNNNWRTSIYIECKNCNYPDCGFRDFLFTLAADGSPLLIPVSDVEKIFGRKLDKSECLLEISNLRFTAIFSQYLITNSKYCPIMATYLKKFKKV